MQSVHAKIGLAALMGAALVSSPALAVTAFSPTGNLNVRSGPGFQYQVMNQISANVPVEITGCVSDYSWCSVALPGGATGWASAPYLVTKGTPGVHDYTGVINISGKREGVVYFTAPRAMLTVLLMKMQETDFSHETMKDLVGEVANTISGNARRDFGRDFVISVPNVVSGDKVEVPADMRPFVIPINWRSHSAKLVVALK